MKVHKQTSLPAQVPSGLELKPQKVKQRPIADIEESMT